MGGVDKYSIGVGTRRGGDREVGWGGVGGVGWGRVGIVVGVGSIWW